MTNQQALAMLQTKSKRFERMLELFNTKDMGLWEMLPDGRVTFYNQAFYEHFDLPHPESHMDDWIRLIFEDDQAHFKKGLETHEELELESFTSTYRVYRKDLSIAWIEAQGVAQFSRDGKIIFMVGTHKDVTHKRNLDNKVFKAAYMDARTGLYNRSKLERDLDIACGGETDRTLLLFRFHPFHKFAMVHGQEQVEEKMRVYLEPVLDRLSTYFHIYRATEDTLALLSHDQVEIGLLDMVHRTLMDTLDRLHKREPLMKSLKAYAAAISLSSVGESVGEEPTVKTVLRRSFMCLTEAQQQKSPALLFHDHQVRFRVERQLHIETQMLASLDKGEFYAVFQPVVKARSRGILGFESLLRWESEKYGAIYPDEFIPVAEQNREIHQLGHFVLDQAIDFIKAYNKHHNCDARIGVNISIIQILQEDFVDQVLHMVKIHNLSPRNLVLEITESLMYEDPKTLFKRLRALKEIGVGISLDDFGAGYASMKSLFITPLSNIKIDKEIITHLQSDQINVDLVKSVVKSCHAHNVSVVAEGIETDEYVEIAKHLGVDFIQGYYFSRPLSWDQAMGTPLDVFVHGNSHE